MPHYRRDGIDVRFTLDFWEAALPDPEQADPEVYKEVFYTLGSRDGVAPLYFPGYQQWDSTIYKKNMDQLWANATSDARASCS